jgi:hypothetical protein
MTSDPEVKQPEIDAIRARHEQAEDDDYRDNWVLRHGLKAHADRATLMRLLDAAREELREVREAAGPFVKLWEDLSFGNPYAPIDQMVWREGEADNGVYQITYGDFRRLAAALKAPPTRAQGESS